MIIIEVREGALDKALKVFKRKFDRHKVLREVRGRQFFVKKSVRRRNEIKSAQYQNAYRREHDML